MPWCEILHVLHLREHRGMRGLPPRRLDWHGLVYLERGRGTYADPGQRRPLAAGDCVLLRPGQPHHYAPDPGTTWDEWVVLWRGELFSGWERAGLLAGAAVLAGLSRAWMVGQWQRVRRALPDQTLAAAHLQVLLAELHRRQAAVGDGLWAERVSALLTQRPTLHPAACARALGLGYHAFRKRCARRFGLGPGALQRRLVLEQAAARLVHEQGPLAALAAAAGFADPLAFSRAFRRQFGCPPSAYRQRFR